MPVINSGQHFSFEMPVRFDRYSICGRCAEKAQLTLTEGEAPFTKGLCSWCKRVDSAPLFRLEAFGEDVRTAFVQYLNFKMYGRDGKYKWWRREKPAPFPLLIPPEPKWWPK